MLNSTFPFAPSDNQDEISDLNSPSPTGSTTKLHKNASSSIPIRSVTRLYRKSYDNNPTYVPTTSVKIGFNSKPIPKTICFNYCVPHVSFLKSTLRQCFNRLATKRISAKLKTHAI
uniref:Uncharacterized protein n=1 Tax=Glossina austeni TaxID=7395 RepID=A0A1A9UY48_GLOAU